MTTLYSVGHGARPVEELVETLRAAGIERLVDVRSFPGSRKHPKFGREALAASLQASGIEYVWRKDLGGFRQPLARSPHTALESKGFRGYADHMETDEFEAALAWLMQAGEQRRTVFMCAETLWWRCHRRLLSDAVEARGGEVLHLMPGGRIEPHRVHPAARIEDGRLVYDQPGPRQQTLG